MRKGGSKKRKGQEVVRVGGTKMWSVFCVFYNTICYE